MRIILALLLLQIAPTGVTVQALDCANPIADHFLVQANAQLTKVYGPVVPAGELWFVFAAGVFEREFIVQPNTEWTMEIIEVAPETGYKDTAGDDAQIQLCCHRVPLKKQTGAFATPVLAIDHSFTLPPGRRLAGRTNNAIDFGISASYWRYPAACASQIVMGMR